MPRLSVGCTFSDRIEALLDGRVTVSGAEIAISIVEAQTLFRRTLREATYDVAELSMASHIAAVGRGRRDFIGLPVFLSRSFRHANLYIRSDRGIARPEDLAGCAIGLVDYQQTAALWLRGLLAEEYGVARESVRWITGGLTQPMLDDRVAMAPPPGITVTRSPATLDALLASGEIDGLISPTAPPCFLAGEAPVARLWSDYRQEEFAYWQRHRLFPIMHVLVLRRSLAHEHPGLAQALTEAFEAARRLATADLARRDFPKLTLPWLNDHAASVHAALGGDLWTYGIAGNRDALDVMLRYARADGLIGDEVTVEMLFQ